MKYPGIPFLLIALLAGTGFAAPDALEQLRIKLDHMAQRSNQPGAAGGTNVVGVRGTRKGKNTNDLYWKGRRKANAATPAEIKWLRAAVEDAHAGKKSEAITSLKAFKEKYPKSPLLADADETLRLLGEPETPPIPK